MEDEYQQVIRDARRTLVSHLSDVLPNSTEVVSALEDLILGYVQLQILRQSTAGDE